MGDVTDLHRKEAEKIVHSLRLTEAGWPVRLIHKVAVGLAAAEARGQREECAFVIGLIEHDARLELRSIHAVLFVRNRNRDLASSAVQEGQHAPRS